MLSPVYFTEALRADDFFLALEMAEEKLDAFQSAPDRVPKFTARDFRQAVSPTIEESRVKTNEEVVSTQLPDENQGDVPGVTSRLARTENEELFVPGTVFEEERPTTATKTCYGCSYCEEIGDDQRVGLVTVYPDGKTLNEFLGAFAPCRAWICPKRRRLPCSRDGRGEA